jgi:hypothetical protein
MNINFFQNVFRGHIALSHPEYNSKILPMGGGIHSIPLIYLLGVRMNPDVQYPAKKNVAKE